VNQRSRDGMAALLAALGFFTWLARGALERRVADDALTYRWIERAPVLLIGTALLISLVPRIALGLNRSSRLVPARSDRERLFRLFVLSFSGLVLELALIRWIGAEVRAFAYFKNFVLVSAFLGFGLGFALGPREERLFPSSLVGLATLAALVWLWNDASIYPALTNQEQTWGHLVTVTNPVQVVFLLAVFLLSLASFFLVLTGTFASLTQEMGTLFGELPRIPSYATNLAGSLAGVVAFDVASWAGTPPALWIALGVVPLALILDGRRLRIAFVVSLGVTLGLAHVIDEHETENDSVHTWSPYYRVSAGRMDPRNTPPPGNMRSTASVNREVMTIASVINPLVFEAEMRTKMPLTTYVLPHVLKPHARRVLVLAAGMGNDVQAALLAGTPERVVAVEIDPAIARFARLLAPGRPFDDPRVELVIDDARHFVETTDQRFDLVVMSFLDSHTLLSGLTQLRTDNFLYTRQCFERVRSLLAPDGVFYVGYASERTWLVARIVAALRAAFDEEPLVAGGGYALCAVGPGLTGKPVPPVFAAWAKEHPLSVPADQEYPTDDRPFLTLAGRSIPTTYWIAIITVLALTAGVLRVADLSPARIDARFLFLGAAFLLAETRLVTLAGLIFGVTWQAYGVAIALVLATLIAGTLVAGKLATPRPWPLYALVVLAIVASQVVPASALVRLAAPARVAAAIALYGPTFFLGSLVFALEWKRVDGGLASLALASNLLGSVAGGLLEYQAIPFGIASLAVTACAFYVLAGLVSRWRS
jgi:hypothetical protein